MAEDEERRTIARWNMQGLDWRSWTVAETTAVLYEELVEFLYTNKHFKDLRTFLKMAGDSRLGALDREMMGQTHGVDIQPTPPLRGRNNG